MGEKDLSSTYIVRGFPLGFPQLRHKLNLQIPSYYN